MQEVGVDVVGLVEYSGFIFKDSEMSFTDFVELILQLRGTNQATVKDIVDLRKQVMQEFDAMTHEMEQIITALTTTVIKSKKDLQKEIFLSASKSRLDLDSEVQAP